MKRLVLAALDLYKRRLSPLLPPACRFAPTCSEYARLAVARDGVVRGGARSLARLARCQPLSLGGIDLP
jgi:putative membrane protein insertion efficiency factor